MRRDVVWVILLLAAFGCVDESLPTGHVEQSIAGGEVTTEYPAVVSLAVEGGHFTYFSGTVISPRVVLTCAHGFLAPGKETVGIDSGIVMFGPHTGGEDADPERTVAIESYRVPPAYEGGLVNDVALVLLAEDALVEPIPVNTQDLATLLEPGDLVRVVGFGTDEDGAYGVRKTLVRPVFAVTPWLLIFDRAGQGTLAGDSGGPHLIEVDGALTLVAETYGSSPATDYEVRIDPHWETFIAPTLAAWEGPCRADGECTTDGCIYPDPDCGPCGLDEICTPDCPSPDPDCPAERAFQVCETDSDCATGLCVQAVDDARVHYCAWPCDVAGRVACLNGFTCLDSVLHADTGRQACMENAPTPTTQGALCERDSECASGQCHTLDRICAEPCETSADCTAPFACVAGETERVCALTPVEHSEAGCAVALDRTTRVPTWGMLALALLALGRRRRAR